MKLTGKTRFRGQQRAFGPIKVVLQVQMEGIHTSFTGGHIESETRTWWRDATMEDLTEMGMESPMGLSA